MDNQKSAIKNIKNIINIMDIMDIGFYAEISPKEFKDHKCMVNILSSALSLERWKYIHKYKHKKIDYIDAITHMSNDIYYSYSKNEYYFLVEHFNLTFKFVYDSYPCGTKSPRAKVTPFPPGDLIKVKCKMD